MTSKKIEFAIFAYLPGDTGGVPAGLLTMLEDGATPLQSTFRYGKRYVLRPNHFELDPLTLAIPGAGTDQVREPPDAASGSGPLLEFGIIRDATPDRWGRRVIENKLKKTGPLPESEYLIHAGHNRTGALDFRENPGSPERMGQLAQLLDLAYLKEAADRIDRGGKIPARLGKIFDAGPSMGGARPKAVVEADNMQWLAKFPARDDMFCVPWIEYATLQLAKKAGMNVPALRLEDIGIGRPVMMIARFDRIHVGQGYERRHFMSALTLLSRHESESAHTSYANISEAIAKYCAPTRIKTDQRELFTRMVFNILVNNNDDHLRNHGFLFDPAAGGWALSPLYDVVPAPAIGFDRNLHLGVGLAGREATLPNALSQHGVFGLTKPQAVEIIDAVGSVVRQWKEYFEEAGVPGVEIDKVSMAFRNPREAGSGKI